MSAKFGRLCAPLLAVGLALGASAALAPSASAAAPATALGFAPATGLASTPMYVVVPQPCPAAATNVSASAFGHGMPATGQIVINNSTSGISHKYPFILPLQDTFTGFAADNGATLAGPYKITFTCSNRLRTTIYTSFSATVTFSDATHYTAPAPSRSVVAAIAASQNPTPATGNPAPSAASSADGSSGSASGTSSGQPKGSAVAPSSAGSSTTPKSAVSGGAVGGAQAPGSPDSAKSNPSGTTNAADAANSQKQSGGSWQPWLVGAAILLILLGILLGIRERNMARRRDAERLAKRKSASAGPVDLTDHDDNEPAEEQPSVTASTSGNSSKGPRA